MQGGVLRALRQTTLAELIGFARRGGPLSLTAARPAEPAAPLHL